MMLDRTLIAGTLGLAAIILAMGLRAETAPSVENVMMLPVTFSVDDKCPQTLKFEETSVDTSAQKPVGSLSLML